MQEKYQNKTKMRAALGTIEVIFSLMIMAVVMAAIVYAARDAKETNNVYREDIFKEKIEKAIKLNFLDILDTYSTAASQITNDASDNWGWRNAGVSNVSPFPTYATATKRLTYRLDNTLITAAQSTAFRLRLRERMNGLCVFRNETNTALTLVCGKVTDITLNPAIAVGSIIDPAIPPIVTVDIIRESSIGAAADLTVAYTDQQHIFTMNDVYQLRRNISLRRFYDIKKAITSFHNLKKSEEIKNSPPNGLVADDDIVIPWFWEIFGNNKANAYSSICSVGGLSCGNLDTNNIWRSGASARGLYMRRLITNALNDNPASSQYAIDGFNNAIFIHPLSQGCSSAGTLFGCAISVPIVPRDDYFNAVGGNVASVPPFSFAIYVETYSPLSTPAPEYGRMNVFLGS